MINKDNLINYFLCNSKLKLPITSSHYINTKELATFKNFSSIENTLTCFTTNLKCFCNNFFYKL